MHLMSVVKERVIVWPDSFLGPDTDSQVRAHGPRVVNGVSIAADVIDVDGPFEQNSEDATGKRHVGWLDGQMHKLVDAPAGAVPTPITNPQALGKLRKREMEIAASSKAAPTRAEQNEGMPEVDAPPPPKGAKKQPAGA